MPECIKNSALRFNIEEIDKWIVESRHEPSNVHIRYAKFLNPKDINSIINKAIAAEKPKGYNQRNGKPGHDQVPERRT